MAMGVVLWFLQATLPLYPLLRIEPGQKVYSRLHFAGKHVHPHPHAHMHTVLSDTLQLRGLVLEARWYFFPFAADLPNAGIKPVPCIAGGSFTTEL